MPKIAFPVDPPSTTPEVFVSKPYPTRSSLTSPDTITLWPIGSSSSEGAYPLPTEPASSSVIIVTTCEHTFVGTNFQLTSHSSAYLEPSQEPPPPEPERTTATTATSIESTVIEYPPASSSTSSFSSVASEESSTESMVLPTEGTSTSPPPEPAQPTGTSSATARDAPRFGFIMLVLGAMRVFVDMC